MYIWNKDDAHWWKLQLCQLWETSTHRCSHTADDANEANEESDIQVGMDVLAEIVRCLIAPWRKCIKVHLLVLLKDVNSVSFVLHLCEKAGG